MLKYFKEIFSNEADTENKMSGNNRKLEIAACALLLEIAKADDNFSSDEKNRVSEIMKEIFHLSSEEVKDIIAASEESMENSISLYEFTDVLNHQLNNDDKYQILKYLWQIAYIDGNLDKYEDHYIKTISNNLHLYNKDRIAAKLEVKEELGL